MSTPLDWTACRDSVAEFVGVDAEKLTPTTHVYDELGIDSLGMFSLGMHLIDRFGVRVPLSEVATIATLGDVFATLQRHGGDRAG